MKGIDVSEHNGYLNFEKIKNSGIEFAMVRAGYGGNHIDKQFRRNMEGFLSVGMNVGAYWFLYSLSPAEAIQEADYFNAALKPYKNRMTFPVACDFEYDSENWMRKCGVTPTKRLDTDIVKAFCSRMEEHGWYVVNYANLDYINNHFYQGELDRFDTWVAQWGVNKCSRTCGIWQYTSDGRVPGSSSRTDMNLAYKDYPAIIKGTKSTAPKKYQISVDGMIGPDTVKHWQSVMKTKEDGIISGQSTLNRSRHVAINAVSYEDGGSQLIRAIQKKIGATIDGHLGPETIKKWQRYIGVNADGFFGPKTAIRTQQWINSNL